VNPLLASTAKISSTPTLVFGALHTCEIDSIILVNRTKNPLSVDITILREIDSVPITFYIANKVPMVAFGKQEILNLCINSQGNEYTETILYVQNGDTIFASSDFVNNLFDCLISYREFTEL